MNISVQTFESLLSILSKIVILFLIFWGTTILFSIAAVSFYIPSSNAQRFQFLHILMNTLFSVVFFLIMAIQMGLRWQLIVILICISLMNTDV